jgi:threonine aldolase
MIDLRSDTVTLPTDEMRAAMASAEVGDDVYGEDPTVNRLQEEATAAVGKEAALFVPTGSMGNLLAVKCHTQPGNEVVIDRYAHIVSFEMGAMAWISGCMPLVLDGARGILDPEQVRAVARADVPYYRARTGLIAVEDSHNYGGGSVYPLETLAAIREVADAAGVPVHMDGARLFNAAVSQGVPAARIAAHADSVMFAFSKGLSAPVGSVLCGPRAFIEEARRVRRVVGGGMRQAGVLAAAALVGLRTMVERLAEDHAMARRLAEGLAELPGVLIDPAHVETNILMYRLPGGAEACGRLARELKERGVLVSQLTPDTLRMVTHRHIGPAEVEATLRTVREALPAVSRRP